METPRTIVAREAEGGEVEEEEEEEVEEEVEGDHDDESKALELAAAPVVLLEQFRPIERSIEVLRDRASRL